LNPTKIAIGSMQLFRILIVIIAGVACPSFLGVSLLILLGGDWLSGALGMLFSLACGAAAFHAFRAYRRERDRQ
jgi:hypothetical protein